MTAKIHSLDTNTTIKYLNIAAKVALTFCFILVMFFNLEATAEKGMLQRAPLFLAPVVIVPILHLLKKFKVYPHTGDLLITLPFLLDTLGNIFGLFDSMKMFDDILHFANWTLLILAYNAFRYRRINDNRDVRLLSAGFGALAIIAWELVEFVVSVDGPFGGGIAGLQLSYADTVGDLVMSTAGGVFGALIVIHLMGAKEADNVV